MRFNGDRLRVLRRFHDLTQRKLAEEIGSPTTAITGYERGRTEPKGLALDALCAVLRVDANYFFSTRVDDEFREHETNFRSLTDTPDRLREKVLAHATLFGTLLHVLTTKAKLPAFKMPTIQASTFEEIERAAEQCRVEWGVGVDAPIHSVMLMLERAGIVVTVLDSEISRKVDAFSRYGATNLIVLNPAKGSATRTRMDLAHEAAHGALHRSGMPPELRLREEQAKHFASAMLLPQKAFAREFWALGKARDWPQLVDLKRRWGASVPAIVTRSYHLGLMDAAEYRRRYKYMSKEGWLTGAEPAEPDHETPQLFSLMLQRYQSETGKSTLDIADDLHWTPDLFRQITGVDAAPNAVSDTPPADEPGVSSFEAFRLRKMAAR